MSKIRSFTSGFTLVEALVVVAVSVVIFGALFSTFQYSLTLLAHSRAKVTATSIAADRMEYFRSLPYNNVGTINGIPPGTIRQNSTTTLNNIQFRERILVEYIDDVADGKLTATTTDSNGIPSDYKRVKIEISWSIKNKSRSISLISNIVPRSIETTLGGGTIRVNVLDASAVSFPGALVTLKNSTVNPAINVTKSTDASGSALFSGAPAGSGYEVVVTAPGYSTDQTYQATVANPNPITASFSLVQSGISTVTFQIGRLSDINVKTFSAITDTAITEEFSAPTNIAVGTDTEVVAGVLQLRQTAGVFAPSGIAYLAVAAPTPLLSWGALTVAASTPSGTEYKTRLYTEAGGVYTLIPDVNLPGNAAGFVGPVIDISRLNKDTYPSIVVGFTLQTTDTTASPRINQAAVYYRAAETARSGVNLSMRGNKVIGTDLSTNPIYKTSRSGVSSGSGILLFSNVEFDTYTFTVPASLDVARACPASPLVHRAGVTSNIEFELVANASHSLRVTTLTGSGQKVPGAQVTLNRAGFSSTVTTNLCGQSFIFSGVAMASDYEVTVTKPGFTTETITGYTINGIGDVIVVLTPS